ncbi:MAG: hypothetical protein KH405_05500 [Firmicutes bacterium]|mgnify:FL=1|nr:hypothetical protein [Bacillota bacterium]
MTEKREKTAAEISAERVKLKAEKEEREKFKKKKDVEDFKRRYFVLYDDVKINYKEDW